MPDERLRVDLEALESAAPAELPPRPPFGGRPRWLPVAATIVVVALAGIAAGIALGPIRDGVGQTSSGSPSASADAHSPTASPDGASEAAITFMWAPASTCCSYIEGALMFASLAGGPSAVDRLELGEVETLEILPGRYELTLFHQPCSANCGNLDAARGHCRTRLDVGDGESILIRVQWHAERPCETEISARPPAPTDPASVTGKLKLGENCAYVLDPYGYYWDVQWPAGYKVDRTPDGAIVLWGPDDAIAAWAGDTVAVRGTRIDAGGHGCVDGIGYRASDVAVVQARTWPPVQAVSASSPSAEAAEAMRVCGAEGEWKDAVAGMAFVPVSHLLRYVPLTGREPELARLDIRDIWIVDFQWNPARAPMLPTRGGPGMEPGIGGTRTDRLTCIIVEGNGVFFITGSTYDAEGRVVSTPEPVSPAPDLRLPPLAP